MADGEDNRRKSTVTEASVVGGRRMLPSNPAKMIAGESCGHEPTDDVGQAGVRPEVGIRGPTAGSVDPASGGIPFQHEAILDGARNAIGSRGASFADRVVLPYGIEVRGVIYDSPVLAAARHRGDAKIRIAFDPADPTHVFAYLSGRWHRMHAVLSRNEPRRPAGDAAPGLAPVQAAGTGHPVGSSEGVKGPTVTT